ncbi:hypothetical protein GCM10011360_33580 [Primorskyibacter flagellatus]|uniref:DUF1674 domain-containing protein n=2 Tax=Primorskyibacter flagellatus TaxID=1387277 RepID=A0A917EJ89_9RHOB|nr:hypothetical protein GCM10011360_33580 [Primorskyibacter flagellatus]
MGEVLAEQGVERTEVAERFGREPLSAGADRRVKPGHGTGAAEEVGEDALFLRHGAQHLVRDAAGIGGKAGTVGGSGAGAAGRTVATGATLAGASRFAVSAVRHTAFPALFPCPCQVRAYIMGAIRRKPEMTDDTLRTDLPPAAQRALAEAEARRKAAKAEAMPVELGGRDGPEPVRFGDWEKKGIAVDF